MGISTFSILYLSSLTLLLVAPIAYALFKRIRLIRLYSPDFSVLTRFILRVGFAFSFLALLDGFYLDYTTQQQPANELTEVRGTEIRVADWHPEANEQFIAPVNFELKDTLSPDATHITPVIPRFNM